MSGRSGFTQAYESLRRRVVFAVRSLVRPADVEDILQEAFLRCYEAENTTDVVHHQSYLLKTAINLAINHRSRAENRLTTSLDALDGTLDLPGDDDIESSTITQERLALYCGIVAELPLQCRRAFILKKVYGLSQREIAAFLEISENTVEKHIAKGILQCAKKIGEIDSRDVADAAARVTRMQAHG